MDHNLIYAKTASGERTVLERTRVMPRNVRMVLILVDSQSSVGDLCLKTGNPQLTESALRELETGGFIEPRLEPDSLWSESRRVTQEVRAAAGIDKASNAGVSSDSGGTTGSPSEASSSSIARRIKGLFSKPSATTSRPGGGAPMEGEVTGAGKRAGGELSVPGLEPVPDAGTVPAAPRAVRRRRKPLNWPTRIAVSLTVVLVALALTLVAFPYARYLPELELALSDASGRPVRIERLRLDLYPHVALLLRDVRLGSGPDAVRIAEIRLLPETGSSLMAGKWVWRTLEVSGVALTDRAIAALPGIFVGLSRLQAAAMIGHVDFADAEISIGGLAFAPMSGEATLSADRRLESLVLLSPDRHLTVALTPLQSGFSVVFDGIDWHPSPESPLVFDSINVSGAYENDTLTIRSMALRFFDGFVEGVATVRTSPQPGVAGEITFKRINAARLESALGLAQPLAGESAGRIRFSSRLGSRADFMSAIDADGEFRVQRGSLRGIDLSEAARSVSPVPTQGGETRFEDLSGRLRLTPDNYRFSELVLNSGLMQATGNVELGAELRLRGSLELRMHGTVNQTRVPMTLGGTLAAPTVQAGRRP